MAKPLVQPEVAAVIRNWLFYQYPYARDTRIDLYNDKYIVRLCLRRNDQDSRILILAVQDDEVEEISNCQI